MSRHDPYQYSKVVGAHGPAASSSGQCPFRNARTTVHFSRLFPQAATRSRIVTILTRIHRIHITVAFLAILPVARAFRSVLTPTPTSPQLFAHPEARDRKHAYIDRNLIKSIDALVERRSEARWEGNYQLADDIMNDLRAIQLASPMQLLLEDVPRSQGGRSTWKINVDMEKLERDDGPSVLQLAHIALGRAVAYQRSQSSLHVETQARERLLKWKIIHERIQGDTNNLLGVIFAGDSDNDKACLPAYVAVEQDLRGRKAADAAFWFALAGSRNTEIFDILADICTKEIRRFRDRPSCRAKDLFSILDRLAMAGLHQQSGLENAIREVVKDQPVVLDMHSERCAFKIWKWSTKQKKQAAFLSTAAQHWKQHEQSTLLNSKSGGVDDSCRGAVDWTRIFRDTSRPLVIDVGCGYGVSLLGLSKNSEWSSYNFLGVDLSPMAIGYASGIAHRWGLDDRVGFVCADAMQVLRQALDYPSLIQGILIQFPTPYRLETGESLETARGNTQLPITATDGFMVTRALVQLCNRLLRQQEGKGWLLIQSNCEDVAVHMREMAVDAGFELSDSYRASIDESPTQRGERYISMGGIRALGKGWEVGPVLPSTGQTETEVACTVNAAPVHRAYLLARS